MILRMRAPGDNALIGRFAWVDLETGRLDTLPLPAGPYAAFDLSPDGRRIAVRVPAPSGPNELWVLDTEGGGRARPDDADVGWTATQSV